MLHQGTSRAGSPRAASSTRGGVLPAGAEIEMVPAAEGDTAPLRSAGKAAKPKRGYRELGVEEAGGESERVAVLELASESAERGTSSTWVIAANNIVYMAAPLAMPATMASCGWVWGSIILGYSILATYHSALLLGEIVIARPYLDSYPKVVGEALVVWAKGSLDGVPINFDMLRRVGSELAVALQFLSYFFDSTAQVLYCAEYFDQLLPHLPVCQKQWLLITWVLTIPLMQAPNFGESSVSVVVAYVCLLLNVATFFAEVWSYTPWNCEPGPTYVQPGVGQIFIGFTAFAYAFGGHGMYPEEVREMRHPKEWPKVVNYTYGTVCTMYVLCAYFGYYAYGSGARANLNSNFPNNALNVFSIMVQLVVTYYCIYVTSLVMLLHIEEHAFGINPRLSCGEYTARTAAIRFIFRTAFVGLQVLLCIMLVGVEGDVLLAMQSLSGAIGMTALTYVLPYMLHWMLHPEKVRSWLLRIWYLFNVVVAVVIMVGGTWFGVKGMVEGIVAVAEAPEGTEPMCHLEFMYSPMSPCDSCYKGGLPDKYYTLPKAYRNETCDVLFDDDLRRLRR